MFKKTTNYLKKTAKSVGNTLLGMIGGKDNVAGLFSLANYNLTISKEMFEITCKLRKSFVTLPSIKKNETE